MRNSLSLLAARLREQDGRDLGPFVRFRFAMHEQYSDGCTRRSERGAHLVAGQSARCGRYLRLCARTGPVRQSRASTTPSRSICPVSLPLCASLTGRTAVVSDLYAPWCGRAAPRGVPLPNRNRKLAPLQNRHGWKPNSPAAIILPPDHRLSTCSEESVKR